MRKRERENPCGVCGHYHRYEEGEVCGICGHRIPASDDKPIQYASAFPTEIWKDFLYLGSYDNASRGELLKTLGISRILNSLKLLSVSNTEIQNISMVDSKFFHILIGQSARVTIKGINISSPADSPNTDGIHIGDSTDIRIRDSTIGSGDDCVSIGPGSTNVTVANVFCGPGHGISVGSLGKYKDDLGVDEVYVTNCTLAGTTNGVRIKTWNDSPAINATNILFYDIVMKEVRNPIIIDQEYCSGNCDEDKPASRVKISNVTFEKIRGSSATDVAINLLCSALAPCDFKLKDINLRPLPPSPGLLPTVPLSTCMHIGNATAEGIIFPPSCF